MKSKPRSKLRGIKLVAQQSCGVFDPRGSRQMDMQACPLGSLLAGINSRMIEETTPPQHQHRDEMADGWGSFLWRKRR